MSLRPSQIHVTVDVVIFNYETDEILLIRRKNDPFKGSWALPGGFVEPGETLVDAAARELLEETNIEVPTRLLNSVGYLDTPGRDPRGNFISQVFSFTLEEGFEDIVSDMKAKDDAIEIKFFDLDEVLYSNFDIAFDHLEAIQMYLDSVE